MYKNLAAVLISLFLLSCTGRDIRFRLENYIKEKKYRTAENFIMEKEAQGDTSKILEIYLGKIYTYTRKYKKASDVLFSIEGRLPSPEKELYINTLLEFGDSTYNIGYKYMAERAYATIFRIDSLFNLGWRFRFLAQRSLNRDDYEQAYAYFRAYLQNDGSIDSVFTDYFRTLYALGKWKEIVTLKNRLKNVKRKADLDWIYGESLFNLAETFYESGIEDSALKYLNEFIDYGTPRILLDDAYLMRAEILENRGDTAQALESYYRVLLYAPKRTRTAKRARERINELEK